MIFTICDWFIENSRNCCYNLLLISVDLHRIYQTNQTLEKKFWLVCDVNSRYTYYNYNKSVSLLGKGPKERLFNSIYGVCCSKADKSFHRMLKKRNNNFFLQVIISQKNTCENNWIYKYVGTIRGHKKVSHKRKYKIVRFSSKLYILNDLTLIVYKIKPKKSACPKFQTKINRNKQLTHIEYYYTSEFYRKYLILLSLIRLLLVKQVITDFIELSRGYLPCSISTTFHTNFLIYILSNKIINIAAR